MQTSSTEYGNLQTEGAENGKATNFVIKYINKKQGIEVPPL